jgi:hypothetical protein
MLPSTIKKALRDRSKERLIKELKEEYSEFSEFFEKKELEIYLEPWYAKSERDLSVINKYFESPKVDLPYSYNSSSFGAAEDAMIELLDFKRYFDKVNSGNTNL